MILPVYAYGHPVLKKICPAIDKDYPELEKLLSDMWETMYNSEGVGLAAPQIGKAIRLFLIDTEQIKKNAEEGENLEEGVKRAFINAEMLEETGEPFAYEEGCLSIPHIRGDVSRQPVIRMRYMDENFVEHEETFTGVTARVIQHEYDHIEGKLFVEYLTPLRRRLIKRKLDAIAAGKISPDYKMRFANSR